MERRKYLSWTGNRAGGGALPWSSTAGRTTPTAGWSTRKAFPHPRSSSPRH